MFEEIQAERPWFMDHVDERVQSRFQNDVAARAHEAIALDGAISEAGLMASSLLLGQYIDTTRGREMQGAPQPPQALSGLGLRLSSAEMTEVIDRINEEVQAATTTTDLAPTERPGRYVGDVDYDERDALGVYLAKIGGEEYDVLPPEEQIKLGAIIQAGRKATTELELMAGDDSSPDYTRQLQDDIEAGRQAYLKMVKTSLRFAVFMAKKYMGRGLPFDDLIQEANCELMDAAEKWDPTKGFKFTSYAGVAIRRGVERALQDQVPIIGVPNDVQGLLKNRGRMNAEYQVRFGRPATDEEFKDRYNITESTLGRMDDAQVVMRVSDEDFVENPMQAAPEEWESEDRGLGLGTRRPGIPELTIDGPSPVPESLIRDRVASVLFTLSEREAGVMRLRYGFVDGEQKNLDEIGKVYGVTRERVRQIETKTMLKLRHPSRSDYLRDLLD